MEKKTIITIPGDGIGKIVLNQTIRVLDSAGFNAHYVNADIGWEFWKTEANPLPQRTIDLIEKHKIVLFGAITSKPNDVANLELSTKMQHKKNTYYSPIVKLRQYFDLEICVRQCKTYVGNPLNFIRKNAKNEIEEPKIDVVIFRQNTEGLYSGVEWADMSDNKIYEAFNSNYNFQENFKNIKKQEIFVTSRIFSRQKTLNILYFAFEHARTFGYKTVTLCEKPNVLKATSGMMYELAKEIQKQKFPEIELKNVNIDAAMMWLTKNPETFDVIVASNEFGDIISDAFAGLIGGLGFAASSQWSKSGIAIFEPVHGSAPKYENLETPISNPIAMIESACLMLDFVNENIISSKIRNAIRKVIFDGKAKTYDMLRLSGSENVFEKGAFSTKQMADEIIKAL